MEKYRVSRKLYDVISKIEIKKIFDLVNEEVDPEAEPLKTLKAQILSLHKIRDLTFLELAGLRDLLGGNNFFDSL